MEVLLLLCFIKVASMDPLTKIAFLNEDSALSPTNKKVWTQYIHFFKNIPMANELEDGPTVEGDQKLNLVDSLVDKLRGTNLKVEKRSLGSQTSEMKEYIMQKDFKNTKKAPGATSLNLFMPPLWMLDNIAALSEDARITIPIGNGISSNNEKGDSNSTEKITASLNNPIPYGYKLFNKRSYDLEDIAQCGYHSNNDEAENLSRIWAMEYKKLKPDQQMFVKKAIGDLLFEAKLGTLHRHSVKINEVDQQASSTTTKKPMTEKVTAAHHKSLKAQSTSCNFV